MSTAKPLHVLIAGGGLSGLALAQGLIKDGHTCEVFERDADDTRKIGYYLHMNADGGEALRLQRRGRPRTGAYCAPRPGPPRPTGRCPTGGAGPRRQR